MGHNIFNIGQVNGVGILFDVTSIYDYWFAGVTFNVNNNQILVTLNIYQRVDGVKMNNYSLSITKSTFTAKLDIYYVLIATFSTNSVSVKINGLNNNILSA